MAYELLDGADRDRWLEALEEEVSGADMPRLGFVAPLLGVEEGESRRARLVGLLGKERIGKDEPRAYRAEVASHSTFAVLAPLYLDFVSMLAFASSDRGFEALAHETFLPSASALARASNGLAVARWIAVPIDLAIDELARSILASRRAHREVPEALVEFAHLLTPTRRNFDA